MDVEPAAAAEGSAKPEEEAAPAVVKKDTKLSLQFGPPKAGLEKTRPGGFFGGFFVCFWFFFVYFLYICPEKRVFRVFSVSIILRVQPDCKL
jgi:hypothetical protein